MTTVPVVLLAGQSNAWHAGIDNKIVESLSASGSAFEFVKVAEGSTSIASSSVADWDPTSPNDLVQKLITAARAAGDNVRAQGFTPEYKVLWVQGEADVGRA